MMVILQTCDQDWAARHCLEPVWAGLMHWKSSSGGQEKEKEDPM